MIARRIIPCLDIQNGRTVKGTNFVDLRDAGDPVELAKRYAEEGADELVFLDITATVEKRKTLVPLVQKIAKEIDIPFTVGGGIDTIDLVDELLQSGADKVSVNSAGIRRPELLTEIADKYGSQCLVVAIDANQVEDRWYVYTQGGRHNTGKDMFEWAITAKERGAGELLFTSMNNDGTKSGFEIEALQQLCALVNIPIIASGGAGKIEDFVEVFKKTQATGALAASVFHFNEINITSLKQDIKANNILIRI